MSNFEVFELLPPENDDYVGGASSDEYDGTEDGLRSYMEGATSQSDWNNRCDRVKKFHEGYPDFWFPTVMLSGLANNVTKRWK